MTGDSCHDDGWKGGAGTDFLSFQAQKSELIITFLIFIRDDDVGLLIPSSTSSYLNKPSQF